MWETIQMWFEQYGYAVLFIGLFLEYIALPFPGETSMAYAGYLAYEGRLNWFLCMVLSFIATTTSISITYWIGYRLGMPFFERYGRRFGLGPDKVKKTEKWFERYGNALIFVAYFIPGVRHVTGYFSGVIRLPFRTFALYAYTGALFWVITFVGIGLWFGPAWEKLFHLVAEYAVAFIVFCAAVFLIVYLIRRRRAK
ncbi:DedA family protein [Paenibacillus turpanensis]|uniref:DedA family protein n=1 Tax=Paenibacillus turpanensis TaxID=2689078 RepID=UPI001408DE6B|nr:DedA family protein [Paenibacillus turpanensis]